MSRKRSGADQVFSRVRFVDHRGHAVGYAILDVTDDLEILHVTDPNQPDRMRRYLNEAPPMMTFTCEQCAGADLRANSARVIALLREAFSDPRRGTVDYHVG